MDLKPPDVNPAAVFNVVHSLRVNVAHFMKMLPVLKTENAGILVPVENVPQEAVEIKYHSTGTEMR